MELKVLVPVLVLLAGTGTAENDSIFFRSTLPPAQKSYKILFLTLTKLRSHMLSHHPLMIALANRGHEVVLLSEASWTDRHPNVTYLDHTADLPDTEKKELFFSFQNPLQFVSILSHGLEEYAKKLFDDPVVWKLYETRKEFDIIIVDELLFKALYPIVHETTFAIYLTARPSQYTSATLGNPLNPAFVPSLMEDFPQPYSTWHRFKNCFNMALYYLAYRYLLPRLATAEIAARFPSLPPPHKIEGNASLFLAHSDFTVNKAFPIPPTFVSTVGILLKPTKPLPKDISEFLSGDTPAIYVSLGSTFGDSRYLPQATKDLLISVLSQLPYKVLLKFDEPNNPQRTNLFIRKWFPQQDVLAHPNVRACMIQGGLQTIQEAIHHGVPFLAVPFLPEHRKAMQGLVFAGQGLILEWSELSAKRLNESIMEIMQNPSYAIKMAEKSRIFNDRRESPMDRAVYWIEYVAKYQGAPHLQSPAKHLTWIEILNLDVIALVLFILYVLFILQVWCIRKFIKWIVNELRRIGVKQKIN